MALGSEAAFRYISPAMSILRLQCPVQHYAWGSTESIPKLLNQENPSGQPWAELWMGAHPKSCATLADGSSLADFIESEPTRILGASSTLNDGKLPFLFKILAADRAVSIQCHPNKAQAREGFAQEAAGGLAINAPDRNYRDQNHKPEFIVALEEFWALKGFRQIDEIASLYRAAGLRSLEPCLALLDQNDLEGFFAALLACDTSTTLEALRELREGLDRLPAEESRWSRVLLEQHPEDIGATAALLLQLVRLERDQGLYLRTGELHAYLSGTALEISASSDNVLRCGLTPKHVDPDELLRVLRFEVKAPKILEPAKDESVFGYTTPSKEFQLAFVELTDQPATVAVDSPLILLCLNGKAAIKSGDTSLELSAGQTAFCPADSKSFSVSGSGRLHIASTPAPQG